MTSLSRKEQQHNRYLKYKDNKEFREKRILAKRRWYQKNKEKINDKSKKAYALDPTKAKEYARKSYVKNKDTHYKRHLEWCAKNKDKIQGYNLNYRKNHHNNELRRHSRYDKLPERKLAKKIWRENNREKIKAHRAVNKNIKLGLLERKITCDRCGNKGKLEAHHDDYNKPLEIVFLCRPCHYLTRK